jgi:hypothetical protein
MREFANSPGCHYSRLAIGETATVVTFGNKTWFTFGSENAGCGD